MPLVLCPETITEELEQEFQTALDESGCKKEILEHMNELLEGLK